MDPQIQGTIRRSHVPLHDKPPFFSRPAAKLDSLLLHSRNHSFNGFLKIFGHHFFMGITGGNQCSLIANIGDVGAFKYIY